MYLVSYQKRDGSWRVVETGIVDPNNPEKIIREPLFFDDFEESLNFAVTQFDNNRFEIMKMCAIGEVENNELTELTNEEGESLIGDYR